MAKAKVQHGKNPSFQIMVCGTTNSGKTKLCNALRGENSPGNIHTSSIDTYSISIDDGSQLRLLDFAGSYDTIAPYITKHYIEQSQICVICIDRQNSHSFEVAKKAVQEIRELDPNNRIPIVIALTKEDQNLGLADYEILIRDRELKEFEEQYGLEGSVKTSALDDKMGAIELRKKLLDLRENIIAREEMGIPDISSIEEYFAEEDSLEEVKKRMDNISSLLNNAHVELTAQLATPQNESDIAAIEKSITRVLEFSQKLSEIKKIPNQMNTASDVEKRDAMLKAYERAFKEFAREVTPDFAVQPKNVKNLFIRVVRLLFVRKWYTDEEKTEIQRFKHQNDFKNRLQRAEGVDKEKNSRKDEQKKENNDDSALDSNVHPEQ
ncbi:GTPase domain-containing protein [Legionella sp. WA2024007413]